jgi:phosphoglycerate dehydrogenase-like enzyme
MGVLVLCHPVPARPYVEALQRLAPDMPVWDDADTAPPDAVEAVLGWRLQPGWLARWPQLRVVCSIGAGVEKLLVPDLPPQLPLTRTVDPQQAQALAQYAAAAALRHVRELPMYAAQQHQARWQRHRQRSPEACRVGVLGQGAVGQTVARAVAALGLPVSLWGRTRRRLPGLSELPSTRQRAGREELPQILQESQVLVCTLPLTPDTQGLLNREALSLLPPGAHLVNIGRGEHVVETDLRALLDEGHLHSATLDVFEQEPPPPDNWVWQHPRVTATPHIAGEARAEVSAAQCLEALQFARAGQPVPRRVDRSAGY